MKAQPVPVIRVSDKLSLVDRLPIHHPPPPVHDPDLIEQLGEKLSLEILQKLEKLSKVERATSRVAMISVPTNRGYNFLSTNEIVSLQAEGSYTSLVLKNGSQLLLSKNLGTIGKMLCEDCFIQPNRSWIVNLNEVVSIELDVKNLVTSNGMKVPIARDRLSSVKAVLGI